MVALQILPFDAHNHVQLGPPPPLLSSPSELRRELPEIRIRKFPERLRDNEISNTGIGNAINNGEEQNNDDSNEGINKKHSSFLVRSLGEYIRRELRGKHISGMAMMATHPRDFSTLLDLEREFSNTGESARFSTTDELTLLPCIGVHPWFLHELNPDEDWIMVPSPQLKTADANSKTSMIVSPPEETVPKWIANIESLLIENPHLPVGEIGLDNFHFDPVTKELTTSMELQIEALKLQLRVATKYHRPVSLHCVRAMGPLMDSLEEIAEENYQRLSERWNDNDELLLCEGSSVSLPNHVLPPRLYFHAFGGKAGTATQLIKTLEKPRRIKIRNDIVKRTTKKKFVSVAPPKVYFGFAPPVNFQSPKTASVIRAVGLERLVLETDREDVQNIGPDMEAGISWISQVLDISKDELVLATNENARDLYGCCGGMEGQP